MPNQSAASNPAIALRLQSTPPAGRVAEFGSLAVMRARFFIQAQLSGSIGPLWLTAGSGNKDQAGDDRCNPADRVARKGEKLPA